MARKSLQSYALQRAADCLGNVAERARRLGISQTGLTLYLNNLEPISEAVFLRAGWST